MDAAGRAARRFEFAFPIPIGNPRLLGRTQQRLIAGIFELFQKRLINLVQSCVGALSLMIVALIQAVLRVGLSARIG